MLLYHFPPSPFARRVRLALAHKGLSAELRDARANPEYLAELRRLNPLSTVPVLVDGERVIADSMAICHYLDRLVPEPPLWPGGVAGAEAFEYVAITDRVVNVISDLGMRCSALHDHANFPAVRDEYMGRVERGLAHLTERVSARGSAPFLCGDRWSHADIAVYTLVAWLEALPARAAVFPPAKFAVALGWSLPPSLTAWADRHRDRADVRALQ